LELRATAALEARPRIGAAVDVAGGEVRLVEEIEDDAEVALKRGRDGRPEVWRVVGVGHRLLARADHGAGRGPVEIDDDVQAVAADHRHVGFDGGAIVRACVERVDVADGEPARFVERYADGVDAPREHREDERVVARAVEDAVALATVAAAADARILRARVVDAEQADDLAVIDECASGDVQRGATRGRIGRRVLARVARGRAVRAGLGDRRIHRRGVGR
jgi:hypothetical protein